VYEYCSDSQLKLPDGLGCQAEARRLFLTLFKGRFTDCVVHKPLFTKTLISSRNSQRSPCASNTKSRLLKRCKSNRSVREHTHTNSLGETTKFPTPEWNMAVKNGNKRAKIILEISILFFVARYTSRGVTRLDGARGKKQVWRPRVRTYGLSEANVLYWRKYLWHCWDFSAPGESYPLRYALYMS